MSEANERFLKRMDLLNEDNFIIEFIDEYKNNKTPIRMRTIYGICKSSPSSLLMGSRPTITTAINKNEYFINQAKNVHGNEYEYGDLFNYTKSKEKIIATCKIHGDFKIRASHFLSGCKCAKCVHDGYRKTTIDEELKNYNLTRIGEYINSHTFVLCTNKEGYKIQVLPSTLKHAKENISPFQNNSDYTIENIQLWLIINEKNFKVLSEKYISAKNILVFECERHGEFKANWSSVKQGHGCPKCGKEVSCFKRRLTNEKFLCKSISIHGNKYDYSNIIIINSKDVVKIICPIHGLFEQSPSKHMSGSGCQKCGKDNQGGNGGYNNTTAERNKEEWKNISSIVYIIKCSDNYENFIKIGITTKDLNKRFCSKKAMPYKYDVIKEINTNLYDAIYIENDLHDKHREHIYKTTIKFDGHTECFSQLDHQSINSTLQKYSNKITSIENYSNKFIFKL